MLYFFFSNILVIKDRRDIPVCLHTPRYADEIFIAYIKLNLSTVASFLIYTCISYVFRTCTFCQLTRVFCSYFGHVNFVSLHVYFVRISDMYILSAYTRILFVFWTCTFCQLTRVFCLYFGHVHFVSLHVYFVRILDMYILSAYTCIFFLSFLHVYLFSVYTCTRFLSVYSYWVRLCLFLVTRCVFRTVLCYLSLIIMRGP